LTDTITTDIMFDHTHLEGWGLLIIIFFQPHTTEKNTGKLDPGGLK